MKAQTYQSIAGPEKRIHGSITLDRKEIVLPKSREGLCSVTYPFNNFTFLNQRRGYNTFLVDGVKAFECVARSIETIFLEAARQRKEINVIAVMDAIDYAEAEGRGFIEKKGAKNYAEYLEIISREALQRGASTRASASQPIRVFQSTTSEILETLPVPVAA